MSGTTFASAHGHRSDIDGMRAFAIAVVVAFHASFPGFDGGFIGVDVFFVISGYLITGVLLRELDEHGRIRLGRFWARRIRRLLPASTAVVLVTLGATVLLLSPIAWQTSAESGVWAAGYAQNFFLAVEEADYFAVETRNPFVHFWSLAIEEQFYVIWPLVMVGLARISGAVRQTWVLPAGLGALAVASFVHSVDLAGSDTTWDYYSPLSRGWEFAAGGLLAVAAPSLDRLRTAATSALATVIGAGLVGYSLFTVDAFTPFPGWNAVPPVVGTALVIAAHNGPTTPAGRLLDLPPVQWVGRMSYGWYLWHFPFLVIAEQWSQSFGPVRRMVVVLLALGAAATSYHLIENPVRFSEWLRHRQPANYAMAAGLLALSLLAAGGAWAGGESRLDDPRYVELAEAAVDFERISDQGCPPGASPEVLVVSCVWGDPDGIATMLVIGDSHADQWIPALDQLGTEQQLRVLIRTVVACPALPSSPDNALTRDCKVAQEGQLDVVDAIDPDVVFVTQWTGSLVGFDQDIWSPSVTSFGQALADRGIALVWVHDPPSFGTNPVDCLGIRSEDACAPDAASNAAATRFHAGLVRDALAGIPFAEYDPVPDLCDDERCHLRIGDDLVYRDSNHLTGTTARKFVPQLTMAISTALQNPAQG